MKRILIFAFIVLLCVSCSPEPHVHEFSDDWSYDENNHWHEAICGDTDEIDAFGSHILGDPEIVSFATYEADGSAVVKCSICSYEKTEVTNKASDAVDGWSEFIDDPTYGRVLVQYDANGKKVKETRFFNTGIASIEICFDPETGMKTSELTCFENGKPQYEEHYWPGKLVIMSYITYDISGSRVENTCDEKGTAYKSVRFNANGEKTMEEENNPENGQILWRIAYRTDGSYEKSVYESGVLSSKEFYDSDGELIQKNVYRNDNGRAVLEYEIKYGSSTYTKYVYDENGVKILYADKYYTGSEIQVSHMFYMDGVLSRIYDYDEKGLIYKITSISAVDGSYIEEFFNESELKYMEYKRDAQGSMISETHFDPATEKILWIKTYRIQGSYTIDTYDETGTFVMKQETFNFGGFKVRMILYYSDGIIKSDTVFDSYGIILRTDWFRSDETLEKVDFYKEGEWFKTIYYKEDGETVDHEEP